MPGTGLYAVKETPTQLDRTQSGAPSGQTVTLSSGGMGVVDAFKGGYITNVTQGETRAIVSHIDDEAILEGDLTNWVDTNDLDVLDAWGAVQDALDQLPIDQGVTDFSAEQRIEIYDGTYDEIMTLNASLLPQGRYRLVMAAASGQTGVILTNATVGVNHMLNLNLVNQVLVEGIEFRSVQTNRYAILSGGHNLRIVNCVFDGLSTGGIGVGGSSTRASEIFDSIFQNFTSYWGIYTYGSRTVRSCIFKNNLRHILQYRYSPLDIAGCTFSGGTSGIYVSGGTETLLAHKNLLRNNTFYNVTYPLHDVSTANNVTFRLEARNNIFQGATAVYYSAANGFYGNRLELDYNCYYSNTAICDDYEGAAKTTLTDWQAVTDDFGDSPDANSLDSDPLMTAPGAGDFSLEEGSPCLHAGAGAGVDEGINDVPFDKFHPDVGAWSSGVGPGRANGSAG